MVHGLETLKKLNEQVPCAVDVRHGLAKAKQKIQHAIDACERNRLALVRDGANSAAWILYGKKAGLLQSMEVINNILAETSGNPYA